MWVLSLERSILNSELLLPKQKFHQQNWFFFMKTGIKNFGLLLLLICWFFFNGISSSPANYGLWSTTFLGTQYIPPSSHYLPAAWKSLLAVWFEEANLLWCFVLLVHLILGLILNFIYFFWKWPGTCKNVPFWVGDEIIFLCPVKRAVEKQAVFSNIYHRSYLLKGSNFHYYTAN